MTATDCANSSHATVEFAAAKAGTRLAELSQFGLIRFAGADAASFLHGQLSCDVAGLQPDRATYGSYNTPKGRMLASFLLWRVGAEYFMQLPRVLCEPILKRLSMYILRSKVQSADASDTYALIGIAGVQAESALRAAFTQIPDRALSSTQTDDTTLLRLDADRFEIVAPLEQAKQMLGTLWTYAEPADTAFWDWTNIRAGIPSIVSATQDQFVPQMANLDLIGGVSFNKGCYPGQEIVARMHYLGRLKQRMYLANIAAPAAPLAGDKLYSADFGDQACGMIVNAAPSLDGGYDVLAVIQIESANRGDVRFKSTDGTALRLLELPYKF